MHNFGMNSLRTGQLEAASATLSGQDSLVILPTGGARSPFLSIAVTSMHASLPPNCYFCFLCSWEESVFPATPICKAVLLYRSHISAARSGQGPGECVLYLRVIWCVSVEMLHSLLCMLPL